jgi:hypothetical protein
MRTKQVRLESRVKDLEELETSHLQIAASLGRLKNYYRSKMHHQRVTGVVGPTNLEEKVQACGVMTAVIGDFLVVDSIYADGPGVDVCEVIALHEGGGTYEVKSLWPERHPRNRRLCLTAKWGRVSKLTTQLVNWYSIISVFEQLTKSRRLPALVVEMVKDHRVHARMLP